MRCASALLSLSLLAVPAMPVWAASWDALGAGALLHNKECALTTISAVRNREQYNEALEGVKLDPRRGLRLEFANGRSIDDYRPSNAAFTDDPQTVLSFRAGDRVQVCPLSRSYCADDRGDWETVLRVYDYAVKRAITGKESRCRSLLGGEQF